MPKFSAQHYNAIAKDIREEFSDYLGKVIQGDYQTTRDCRIETGVLVNLALRFAHRFKEDNDRFDPLKFLDACSPDSDLYPLSELWEE